MLVRRQWPESMILGDYSSHTNLLYKFKYNGYQRKKMKLRGDIIGPVAILLTGLALLAVAFFLVALRWG